jgi:hypothetical protein
MVEAKAGEAEASLNALLEDAASMLRILDFLRKWLGDKLEEIPANCDYDSSISRGHG